MVEVVWGLVTELVDVRALRFKNLCDDLNDFALLVDDLVLFVRPNHTF